MTDKKLTIIGAGLAGSEAAWQAANAGINVTLIEMRPTRETFAHQTQDCAELVCSNSFRSDDATRSAIGLLHEEMRQLDSVIIRCGDASKLPAGGALAVDRDGFSAMVTQELTNHPNITLERREVTELPSADEGMCIVATGPLTSDILAESILAHTGEEYLSFFDAIAPIILKESIDFEKAWFQSRYDKGSGKDYINLPMDKEQYETFIQALNEGDKTEFKDWEKDTPYFEGCLPIEVMAERGPETLRWGPMKPVGLTNPHNPTVKAHAIVQLRQDNALGTLFNMVGFQTKLKWGAQKEIFSTIPGLENADFVRLGGIHRNTFINSPALLDEQLRLKKHPHLRFAGQVTGVEGYVESASSGLMAGRFAIAELLGQNFTYPPQETAIGALMTHVTTGAESKTFQPMNVNFGLLPPFPERVKKKERKEAYCTRGMEAFKNWKESESQAAA